MVPKRLSVWNRAKQTARRTMAVGGWCLSGTISLSRLRRPRQRRRSRPHADDAIPPRAGGFAGGRSIARSLPTTRRQPRRVVTFPPRGVGRATRSGRAAPPHRSLPKPLHLAERSMVPAFPAGTGPRQPRGLFSRSLEWYRSRRAGLTRGRHRICIPEAETGGQPPRAAAPVLQRARQCPAWPR